MTLYHRLTRNWLVIAYQNAVLVEVYSTLLSRPDALDLASSIEIAYRKQGAYNAQ